MIKNNDVIVRLKSNLKKCYIKRPNGMNDIHENELNKTSEFNLLHDILNPSKITKNINSHYYPILNVCMNIRKGRAKLNYFRIILDSGCTSKIVTRRLITKLNTKIDTVMKCHTQVSKITANLKVKIY